MTAIWLGSVGSTAPEGKFVARKIEFAVGPFSGTHARPGPRLALVGRAVGRS